MMEIIDCEQGSAQWFAARAGIPTASEFSTVMAKGRDGGASITRAKYMRRLAYELYSGEPAPEGYSNAHMERGRDMEDEARRLYAFMEDATPERVGFVRAGRAGCSPDSLIGAAGGLEIKTAIPEVQIERLQRGTLPTEYRAQVQGSLWLTGRDWWDFCSYWPKLPPLIIRVQPDRAYIADLASAVDAFNEELDAMVESLRRYGSTGSMPRDGRVANNALPLAS